MASTNQVFQSPLITEAAIVFRAGKLAPGKMASVNIPQIVTAPGISAVFRNQLILACITIPSSDDALLVFSPATGSCAKLDDGFYGLAGERSRIEEKLEDGPYIIVMAQVRPSPPAGTCSCPGEPVEVVVTAGESQTVAPGEIITTIVFAATDADSDMLTEEFSHTFDGGSTQSGVPLPLINSCDFAPGTADCTVSGNAPALEGQYLIRLEVTDGLSPGFAIATLNVESDPPPMGLFSDGFENQP